MTTLYERLGGVLELVNSLKTKAFLSGISSKNIYVDSFLPSVEK